MPAPKCGYTYVRTQGSRRVRAPNEPSKPPVTGPDDVGIQDVPDKNIRIIILKTLRPKIADKQCKDVKKTMQRQIEKFKNKVDRKHKNEPKRNLGAEEDNEQGEEELSGELSSRARQGGKTHANRNFPVTGTERKKNEQSP